MRVASSGDRTARGARGARGDIVVIVDVLSFSTAVGTAVAEGLAVMPCTDTDDLEALAEAHRAAVGKRRELADGGISLSPLSLTGLLEVERILLRSPNGARCVRAARDAGASDVFACALVTKTAVARAVARAATDLRSVSVVACGERWDGVDLDTTSEPASGLRVAIEDSLGAGAFVDALRLAQDQIGARGWASPEARVAELAWRGAEGTVERLLRDAISGLELRRRGFARDVGHAASVDRYDVAPRLDADGCSSLRSLPEPAFGDVHHGLLRLDRVVEGHAHRHGRSRRRPRTRSRACRRALPPPFGRAASPAPCLSRAW